MIVNTDINSWPSGDRVWEFCHAIAIAEGYILPNSVPARLHNPGDISDESHVYGFELHDGSRITDFPDDDTGWKFLYQKINNAFTGKSHVYYPGMTFAQFARKYAGDSQDWLNNVCEVLDVLPDTVIGDWFHV